MIKNFCGSVADSVMSTTNLVYVRFYAEKNGIQSQFVSVITSIRTVEGPDDQCDPEVSFIVVVAEPDHTYVFTNFSNSYFLTFTFSD